MTSGSATRVRGDTGVGQARSTGRAMAVALTLCVISTLGLLIAGLVYYSGSSGRIASDYTSVASPANVELTAELDLYAVDQDHDLAAAQFDLSSEARTEASFDNLLGEVAFPGAAATAADALVQADQKREKLIKLQAQANSLSAMRSFDSRVQTADAAVETQVQLIRQALGLPPSSGQLY